MSLVLLGVVAFIGCDLVNAKLGSRVDDWLGRARPSPVPQEWVEGATVAVELTLITKDADRLACADDRDFDGHHCEYNKAKRRWPREPSQPIDNNKADVIQPYRTAVGNYLVMVAGLWATPELAMRRHLEPARGTPDKQLRRFIARCDLRFLGKMDGVEVRWDYNQKWYAEGSAPVAVAEACTLVQKP